MWHSWDGNEAVLVQVHDNGYQHLDEEEVYFQVCESCEGEGGGGRVPLVVDGRSLLKMNPSKGTGQECVGVRTLAVCVHAE